jgi:hypothetical protein
MATTVTTEAQASGGRIAIADDIGWSLDVL